MAGGDVRGERDRSDTDRVAGLEPMVDTRGGIAENPNPDEGSQRQDKIGIITTGSKGVGARVAGPQLGT